MQQKSWLLLGIAMGVVLVVVVMFSRGQVDVGSESGSSLISEQGAAEGNQSEPIENNSAEGPQESPEATEISETADDGNQAGEVSNGADETGSVEAPAGGELSVEGSGSEVDVPEDTAATPIPAGEALIIEGKEIVVEDELITPENYRDETPSNSAAAQFSTDFLRHTISYAEILSGGPPKDGIPSIDAPTFVSISSADSWINYREPVVVFQHAGDVRAYPLQILTWHEIVNDIVGGRPVVITFCPLCNTAIAFDRTFDGQVLDFGTTGRLRYSNLLMYDRQTETWWQQATGTAVVGKYAGSQLAFLPAPIISWRDFKLRFPDGLVLSRDTGYVRRYGQNPYGGYDDINSSPFLYDGPRTPDTLRPMERVVTVDLDGEAAAYPYELLKKAKVVNDEVSGRPVVVFWRAGTVSVLDDRQILASRDVGTANVYSRNLDDRVLTFEWVDDKMLDSETGSEWNLLGEAISGPLTGSQLEPVVAVNHFWFSWAAFKPETRVYSGNE